MNNHWMLVKVQVVHREQKMVPRTVCHQPIASLKHKIKKTNDPIKETSATWQWQHHNQMPHMPQGTTACGRVA
jgi:hypothetical protein